jgi:hypothetical protein
MSPSQWGPPTWVFFHTLAAKIKEGHYDVIGPQVIRNIIAICGLLPCPECSVHAKQFWAKVNINKVNTREDLINLLYVFHNTVNRRKQNRPFQYVDLQYYKTLNLIDVFNNFTKGFHTKGNMNLLTESFHRSRLLTSLKQWLMSNIGHFDV